MKKTALFLLFSAFTVWAFAANNFEENQKRKHKKHIVMKKHICTAACKDGHHMYAHGEKGHVCGPECMKKAM